MTRVMYLILILIYPTSVCTDDVMKMLLLFGVITVCWVASRADDVAYIQIFDFIEQNKTGPNDPAIVLTEVVADLFTVSSIFSFAVFFPL